MNRVRIFSCRTGVALFLWAALFGWNLLTPGVALAATKYWIGPAFGSFSSNTNWSTTSGGTNDTTAPGAVDTAVFDGGGANNCNVDAGVVVGTLSIGSGYTGTVSVAARLEVSNNLTIGGGTLAGTGTVIVKGGSVTGDGVIAMTGGLFLLTGTGNFGGATDWSFYDLTFGDNSTNYTTAKTGNNKVTVTNQLLINATQTLQAGTGTWNLSWGNTRNTLSGVSKIASGQYHSVALKTDGTVFAWGDNTKGQLGDNSTTQRNAPVQVLGVGGTGFLNGVSALAAGGSHTVAVTTGGAVFAWGDNTYGQLGDNSTTQRNTPVQVVGVGGSGTLSGASSLAAGLYHTVALQTDGTVFAWGNNGYGQLGDNTTTQHEAPVQVVNVGGSGTLSGVSALAAGEYHTVALKTDGTVFAWGMNLYGQLGDNTTTQRNAPVQVRGVGNVGTLSSISAIAAGSYHTVAVKTDGSVCAWGHNTSGQLGDNTQLQRNAPVQVRGVGNSGTLSGISTVAAGAFHTVAIKTDGTVLAWGYNATGQLGDYTVTQRTTPIQVLGVGGSGNLSGISRIAGGYAHTVALKTDGAVVAWGDNTSGQLGDTTTTQSKIAVQVVGVGGSGNLSGISVIAAGYNHTVALKIDGTVFAWGNNNAGQLGDNTTTQRTTPVQVVDVGGSGVLSGVSAIAAGYIHTVALKADGTVYGWGDNYKGQLGDGTFTPRNAPVQARGVGGSGILSGVSAIAAGSYHTVALKADGTVFAWGLNLEGELGDNTTTNRGAPVQVLGVGGSGILSSIAAIAAGQYHTVALTTDGTVCAWGYNNAGQLGDNTTTQRNVPVQVLGVGGSGILSGVSAIRAGSSHTVALKTEGTVFAWGDNMYGQLGDNTVTQRNTPVQVLGVGGSGTLSGVSAIAATYNHTVAVKTDGTVFAWGANSSGQLGDTTTTESHAPVQVLGVSGITAIAAGQYHTAALKADGTFFAWGSNAFGQLGDATLTQRNAAVQVRGVDGSSNLSGVSAIAAGASHTLALKADGTVFAWGLNLYGQLGDTTTTNRSSPVQVVDVGGNGTLSGVAAIAAGYNHSIAVKADGTVFTWGDNGKGQLGNNSSSQRNAPVQVLGVGGSGTLSGVSAIAAGLFHTVALKTDGTVFAWGLNSFGQLGDNTTTQRNTPVQVVGVNASGTLSGVSRIAAGQYHTLALKTDGSVFAWGDNTYWQLGDNTTTQRNAPVPVLGVNASGTLGGVSRIAAGQYHSIALKTDGTVVAWGVNSNGQLGDNTTTLRSTPVQVLGVNGSGTLSGVSAIAGGYNHTVALKADGTVFAWGNNTNGQLGDNATTTRKTPVQVLGVDGSGTLSGVSAIAALGSYHTGALKTDGTVVIWGDNSKGQVGDNTLTQRKTPVQVLAWNMLPFINNGTFTAETSLFEYSQNPYGFYVATSIAPVTYYGLKINNALETFALSGTTTATNALTINAGGLAQAASALTVSGQFTIASGATFTKSTNATALTLNGTTSLTDNNTTKQNLGALVVAGSAATTSLGSNTTVDSLTINAGNTLHTHGYDLRVGTGGITIPATATLNATDDVAGDRTLIYDAGNWSNSGTFTGANSTVTLNGTSQKVLGSNSFYNLTKDVSSLAADTLMFQASRTQSIAAGGTLTLKGGDGATLTLRACDGSGNQYDGHQWGLNVNGSGTTVAIDRIDVKDSDASAGISIVSTNYTDSGNNLNWLFNTAPSISAGPSDGSSSGTSPTTAGSNVTFTATATDAESNTYYLAICKTDAISGQSNAAPTCGGGAWCVSAATAAGSPATCSYATTSGDAQVNTWYAFVCDHNSESKCSISSQGAGNDGSPFEVNHLPSFSGVTNTSGYLRVGQQVSFTATGSDADASGTADMVGLYVCKSNDFTGSACGAAGEWCHSSLVSSDPSCAYTVLVSDSDGAHTYYAYVIDSHGAASASNPRSAGFNTDKTAPTVNAGIDQTKRAEFTQSSGAGVEVTDSTSGVAGYLWSQVSGPGTITFTTASVEYPAIAASTDGVYVLRLTATDNAGNSASDEFTLRWDTTGPTVTISSTAPSPTIASPIPVSITFSEEVVDFTENSLTLGNAVPVQDSFHSVGDAAHYVGEITPSAGKVVVTVDLPANTVHDAAGNGNAAALQLTKPYGYVRRVIVVQ